MAVSLFPSDAHATETLQQSDTAARHALGTDACIVALQLAKIGVLDAH